MSLGFTKYKTIKNTNKLIRNENNLPIKYGLSLIIKIFVIKPINKNIINISRRSFLSGTIRYVPTRGKTMDVDIKNTIKKSFLNLLYLFYSIEL